MTSTGERQVITDSNNMPYFPNPLYLPDKPFSLFLSFLMKNKKNTDQSGEGNITWNMGQKEKLGKR